MTNTLTIFCAILIGVGLTGLIITETVRVCTKMFKDMLVGFGELLSGTGEGVESLLEFKEEYDRKVIDNYKKQQTKNYKNFKKEDP